jgi:hypothetical protein
MKTYKKVLRYWFAIASALSFLGGWIILAHSPKPVETTASQTISLPTLAPLPSFNSGINANPQFNTGMPLLRTRGS